MRVGTWAFITLAVSLWGVVPNVGSKRIAYNGRIVAYRPADAMQVASFVTNRELFLFRTEDGKWLKLIYRHQGYSDIKGDVRSGAEGISIYVRRASSCDQTLGVFEKEAAAIPLEGGNTAASTERVVFASSVSRPPKSYRMRCYVLEHWKAD